VNSQPLELKKISLVANDMDGSIAFKEEMLYLNTPVLSTDISANNCSLILAPDSMVCNHTNLSNFTDTVRLQDKSEMVVC
jgi:hypothetical protein